MTEVQPFETVISPEVERGICESIGKGDEFFLDYIELLDLLVEHCPAFLYDFLSNTSILSSLIRLTTRYEFYVPIIDFFYSFADLSVDASSLLVDFGAIDILASNDNIIIFKKENDVSTPVNQMVLCTESQTQEHKRSTIKFFVMMCIANPLTMLSGDFIDRYLTISFDFLPSMDEDYCLRYVIALRNLLDNGMSMECISEFDEVSDFLRDCIENCQNDEIRDISQYTFDTYFDH